MKTKLFLFPIVLLGLFVPTWISAQGGEIHKIEPFQKNWIIPQSISLEVVGENGGPVLDAKIKFDLYRHEKKDMDSIHVREVIHTDTAGKASLSLSPELSGKPYDYSSLQVEGKGLLLSESKNWTPQTSPASSSIAIPDKIKITLREGKMVRFRIVDENNNGIEGVEIQESPFAEDPVFHTDSKGFWEFGPVKKDFNNHWFSAKLRHPDFEILELRSLSDTFPRKSDSIVVPMKHGREISGSLKDEQGNPVEGAEIFTCGDSHLSKRVFRSDEEGKFHLKGLQNSQQLIIIKKKGMVEKVLSLAENELEQPLDLILQKGKTLRIRFETEFPEEARYFGLALPVHIFGDFEYRPRLHHSQLSRTPEERRAEMIGALMQERPLREEQGSERKDYTLFEWEEAPDEELEFTFTVWSFVSTREPFHDASSFRSEQETYHFKPREEPYTIKVLEVPRKKIDPDRIPWPFYDDWKIPESLRITVLDEKGKPKPDASVRLHLEFSVASSAIAKTFSSDSQGIVEFDLSSIDNKTVRRVFITVSGENCRSESLSWYSDPIRGERKTGAPIPERMEVLLHPKDRTVGIIRDEDGNPIEGVKITLKKIWNCSLNGVFGKDQGRYNDRKEELHTATDSEGIWSFNLVPQNQGYCEFTVEKEGFISKRLSIPWRVNGYEYSRITTLHRTKRVSGIVVDSEENPIPGVRISLMNAKKYEEKYGVETDEQGKFTLNVGTTINDNTVDIRFEKSGMPPHRETLDLTKDTGDLRYTLSPGKTLKLRFVDEEGKGVPGVSAGMYIPDIERLPQRRFWSGITENFDGIQSDVQGELAISNVPEQEMEYHFGAPGQLVAEQDSYRLQPTEEEQVIKMLDRSKHPMLRRKWKGSRVGESRSSGKNFGISWNFGSINYRD